ncbi:glycosyltransferase [Saccharicrinis sp. FJH62]|uniref:glycosyltransferase n=1 Tax=Saccharicrinis sp. FJH62 TaxID=3344657 RepID=UPI0035D49ADA
MNILFITQLFPEKTEGCYTSNALREFVEEWGRIGHKVQVVRPHFKYEVDPFPTEPNFAIGNNINVEFIKPLRIPLIKFSFYSQNRILQHLMFQPDIIICHLYNSYFTFPNLASKLSVPLVIGIHMSDIKLSKNKFFKWRQKRIFKKASGLACRSHGYKKKFDSSFPEFRKLSFLALSGIPENFIKSAAHNTNLIIPETTTNLVTVSSLIKRKQIDKVIMALNKLKEVNWHYTIIGEGPELNNLKQQIISYNLTDRITFTGKIPRKSVLDYLIKSNIFILPSYDETLGLVYLEAMALGNITIGSIDEGIDGIIEHGKNGYLCDATSDLSIYESLNHALSLPPDEYNSIIISAKKTISEYSISEQSKRYLNNLKRILEDDSNQA